MEFELLTLTGTKYQGDVAEVTLTTADGQIGIFPNHEDLTAQVMAGPVTIREKGGKQQVFATFGGLMEVTKTRMRLLADEAEHESDLDQAQVQKALAEAEAQKASVKDKHELARAQEMVDRQSVRLGVAKLNRRARPERQNTPPE
jgi:F-type H+-transporting ATPase subunit epsilon